MLYTTLHYITLHYITLHYITLHYITLHYITLHCIALHCIALHCIALHCIALHCIALHCITLHYITLHYVTLRYVTLHYITLHYRTLHSYTHTHTNINTLHTYLHSTLQYITFIHIHTLARHELMQRKTDRTRRDKDRFFGGHQLESISPGGVFVGRRPAGRALPPAKEEEKVRCSRHVQAFTHTHALLAGLLQVYTGSTLTA